MKIPFVDLKIQYLSIKQEIDNAINKVISDTAFIGGKYVVKFEEDFAKANGVNHCVSVANGTDAIYIALKALNIGPGDEVITVANSWISTSEAITQTGAKVVFIDIEPEYYTIDVSKIEKKITSRTKAIIPVHLFGLAAKMDELLEICRKHDLFLIEDCAQAHFAKYKGQNVGTFGIAGTFSFFPGKNLGAYGDAGAIITKDDEFAKKARMFANHGALKKHYHEIEGINSRLDGIQAAILSVKLPYIHYWNQSRLKNAELYSNILSKFENINIPHIREDCVHVFHLYVIRCSKRDQLQNYLEGKGIMVGIHYPTPLPFLPAYKYLNYCLDDFPVSAQYQHEILSLPMYAELTEQHIEYIVECIKSFRKLH